jgi:deazaflavin-dependent oxidoreductase (nitroreductase family)
MKAKALVSFHKWLYRSSGGRLLSKTAGLSILLLTTRGRRTGRPRTTPLVFMRFEDEPLVLASNWGQEVPPVWYLNLQATPEAEVQIRAQRWRVRAEVLSGELRARAAPAAAAYNPHWKDYLAHTRREIPLVHLRKI